MADHFPSVETLRERLAGLTHAEVHQLANETSVPFTTLWKIRTGETVNPGVETVRKFWSHLPERRKEARAK